MAWPTGTDNGVDVIASDSTRGRGRENARERKNVRGRKNARGRTIRLPWDDTLLE